MSNTALAVVAARFRGVRVASEDSPGWTNTLLVPSSSSNSLYRVALNVSNGDQMRGKWGCSCRGYIMSAKRNNGVRTCTHLQAMLPALEAAFPAQSTATPVAKRVR